MKRENVIKLAHKHLVIDEQHYGARWADRVLDFVAEIEAVEREACAQLCEGDDWNVAAAIVRARREK